MSKLQSFKRIIVEDFDQKDRALVSKLAYAVNIFAEDVLNTFNNRVSIEDNLNIVKKDITITVDMFGNTVGTLSVKTGLDHACQGILVIKVTDLVTANRPPSGTPFITFTENSGLISITNITNLVGNNPYKLRIILF